MKQKRIKWRILLSDSELDNEFGNESDNESDNDESNELFVNQFFEN